MSARGPLGGFLRRRPTAEEERRAQRAALAAFQAALDREIERSRRYERHFALLAADLSEDAAGDGWRELVERLAVVVRGTDHLCVTERRLYLLMPEADADAASQTFDRILAHDPRAIDGRRRAIAAFPADGVTAGALMEALRRSDAPVAPDRIARIERRSRDEQAG